MLKKLAILLAICAAPFLSPNFRLGYKHGFNNQIDKHNATHLEPHPFTSRKFKNL